MAKHLVPGSGVVFSFEQAVRDDVVGWLAQGYRGSNHYVEFGHPRTINVSLQKRTVGKRGGMLRGVVLRHIGVAVEKVSKMDSALQCRDVTRRFLDWLETQLQHSPVWQFLRVDGIVTRSVLSIMKKRRGYCVENKGITPSYCIYF